MKFWHVWWTAASTWTIVRVMVPRYIPAWLKSTVFWCEFPVDNTSLRGRTVRDTRLRELTGLSVVATWERGRLLPASPDSQLTSYSVAVVVGTQEQLTELDALFVIYQPNENPVVVIGGGTAGLITAAGAAGLGARAALVERHLLGGDCLTVGCVPSKALIRPSRLAAEMRQADRFGLTPVEAAATDFPAVMERLRRIRADISHHDSARRYRDELGVDVFIGEGAFAGPDSVPGFGTE